MDLDEVEKVLTFNGFKEKSKLGKFFWMIRWLILSPYLVLYGVYFLLFDGPKMLYRKFKLKN
jgi:hypothetical protein